MKTGRILKVEGFEKFARKQDISDASLLDAVRRAESGLVDADLGGGLIKQRVARQGAGKSGGYRTIVVIRCGDLAVFLFGFAKSARANITAAELQAARKLAKQLLAMTEAQIAESIADGYFVEVEADV